MYISSAESKKSKSFFFFFLPNIDESLVTFFCVSVVLWFCFKREISLFLLIIMMILMVALKFQPVNFFLVVK